MSDRKPMLRTPEFWAGFRDGYMRSWPIHVLGWLVIASILIYRST